MARFNEILTQGQPLRSVEEIGDEIGLVIMGQSTKECPTGAKKDVKPGGGQPMPDHQLARELTLEAQPPTLAQAPQTAEAFHTS